MTPAMPQNHGSTSDLTDTQRELLQTAVREGYFEVPREIALVELAEKHGISDREASEEMLRGLSVVLCWADLHE